MRLVRLYHSMEMAHERDVYILTDLSVEQMGDLYSRLCKYLRKEAEYGRYVLLMPDVFARYLELYFGARIIDEDMSAAVAWLCGYDHFALVSAADQDASYRMVTSLMEVGQFDVFALWPYISPCPFKEVLEHSLETPYVRGLIRYFSDRNRVHNGDYRNLAPLEEFEVLYVKK